VSVRNQGAALAPNVRALLRVGGTTVCNNLVLGDIGPGLTTMVVCTAPWIAGGDPCAQVLEACADPTEQIPESNEANNCHTTAAGTNCVTDLALFANGIHVTPPNPSIGQNVLFEVGVWSLNRVESTCLLTADWSADGMNWIRFATVPLHIPPDVFFIPAAATFNFVALVVPSQLRFSLLSVFPPDEQPKNNVLLGSLPWFEPPATPVVVTDLVAESTPDGVRVRWRAEAEVTAFGLDRRREGDIAWQRLPGTIAVAPGSGVRDYEFVDRDAEPGMRLEYRLVGRLPEGGEAVLGTLTITHDAAGVATLQLYPVRPNPFRAGGAFEFAVPRAAAVDLSVFDAAGRRVVALRRGTQPAGRHAVSWDGRDSTGRRVPAGVYFCRLASDAFEQTRRVVLVR
jgi:FlgD Ig-like domain/CARDB